MPQSADSLGADEARFDAVLFNILVIGESAKRLADLGVGDGIDIRRTFSTIHARIGRSIRVTDAFLIHISG